MLTGAPTSAAHDGGSLIVKQLTERPAPLATRVPGVPRDLAAAVAGALEKEPRRPLARRRAAMARALDGELSHGAPGRVAGRDSTARRRRVVPFAAAALLVTLSPPGSWCAAAAACRPASTRAARSSSPFRGAVGDRSSSGCARGASAALAQLARGGPLGGGLRAEPRPILRDAELENARRVSLDDALRWPREAAPGRGHGQVIHRRLAHRGRPHLRRGVGTPARRGQRSSARAADPRSLYDALARDLLDLVGAPPVTLELAKTTTSKRRGLPLLPRRRRRAQHWKLDQRTHSSAGPSPRTPPSPSPTTATPSPSAGSAPATRSSSPPWRRANQFAGRLPARERGMVAAYTTSATPCTRRSATTPPQRNALYVAAQGSTRR